jgi:hypothetical protein
MNSFYKLTVIAEKLNRMPVNYKSFAGREYTTYYTTHELLSKIVLNIGIDNSLEKEFRNLEDSCLKELGFKQMGLFTDKLSGKSIAILGI